MVISSSSPPASLRTFFVSFSRRSIFLTQSRSSVELSLKTLFSSLPISPISLRAIQVFLMFLLGHLDRTFRANLFFESRQRSVVRILECLHRPVAVAESEKARGGRRLDLSESDARAEQINAECTYA